MSKGSTAADIREMARRYRVSYAATEGDVLAHHMSRLADSEVVKLDEIERLLLGLRRAGYLSPAEMIRLQARYLNESKK